MSEPGFRLTKPHSPECYLAPSGRAEFVVYDGWENRDARGRKYADGRGQWWHRFTCNCTSCDACVLVRWDVLMDFIAVGLGSDGLTQAALPPPESDS